MIKVNVAGMRRSAVARSIVGLLLMASSADIDTSSDVLDQLGVRNWILIQCGGRLLRRCHAFDHAYSHKAISRSRDPSPRLSGPHTAPMELEAPQIASDNNETNGISLGHAHGYLCSSCFRIRVAVKTKRINVFVTRAF